MGELIIFLIIVIVVVFFFLRGTSLSKKKTREQALQDLTHFLEGTREPIAAEDDASCSYRIRFQFGGEPFIYEDHEKQGFKNKVYEAYLRVKTPSTLTLAFTEKQRSTTIRTDIFIASDISSQDAAIYKKLHIPKVFKDLNVSTNDTDFANALFEDWKITDTFKRFKNVDSRGYPFLSIGIVKGEVILVFHEESKFNPSLMSLYSDIASMEDYLDQMLILVKKLKTGF